MHCTAFAVWQGCNMYAWANLYCSSMYLVSNFISHSCMFIFSKLRLLKFIAWEGNKKLMKSQFFLMTLLSHNIETLNFNSLYFWSYHSLSKNVSIRKIWELFFEKNGKTFVQLCLYLQGCIVHHSHSIY